jgi:hypothetical protein
MNDMNTRYILRIVIDQCQNGCVDARSAYQYFESVKYSGNMQELHVFLMCLNFEAIRENSAELLKVIEN